MLLDFTLSLLRHLFVICHLACSVEVLRCFHPRFRSERHRGSADLGLKELLSSLRIVQIVGQVLRVGEHHLGTLTARIYPALAQSVKDGRFVLITVSSSRKTSIRVLGLLSIRLERALSI